MNKYIIQKSVDKGYIRTMMDTYIDNLFRKLSKDFQLINGDIEPMEELQLENIKGNLYHILVEWVLNNKEYEMVCCECGEIVILNRIDYDSYRESDDMVLCDSCLEKSNPKKESEV